MALFVFFDDDESGGLSRREVGRLARWLNFARTDEDIDRMFRDMDMDGSGMLCLDEFLMWLSKNRPDPNSLYGLSQLQYNTVMMQFHSHDTDQDGLISVEEFARLATRAGDVPDIESGRRLFYQVMGNMATCISLHEFLIYRSRMSRRPVA
ncbi:EF hand domain [Trypanosoma vivax]|nr:EF hand domain [Trypanosoma vivax]